MSDTADEYADLMGLLDRMEKLREACPNGPWDFVERDGYRGVHVRNSFETPGGRGTSTFHITYADHHETHDLPPQRSVMQFVVEMANHIALLCSRLRVSEGLLRDMADLDGLPMPMIRRYREALQRIANLDPRAVNVREHARRALEAYPTPDEEEVDDRAAWTSFKQSLDERTLTMLERRLVNSFEALATTTDSELTGGGRAFPSGCLEEVYRNLAAFGHPRIDPGIKPKGTLKMPTADDVLPGDTGYGPGGPGYGIF